MREHLFSFYTSITNKKEITEKVGTFKMVYEKINDKILEMQDEMLGSIQDIMKIESVKGEPQPNAPYGPGPKAALDAALALGEKFGFKTGHADNRIGWIEFGEGEEMVGVLGHLDVVPAGDGWTYPAYGAEIHDGILWGRGCLDDKGPIIGCIYALKAIRDLNLPIDRRIRVLFGCDEECGSSCAQYYVDNGYEMPTIGFTPDGDFPVIFCEKGISDFEIGKKITDKGNIKVEYFGGGLAPNMVTPTCQLIVEGPLKVSEAEGVTVKEENGKTIVDAVGVSAHGSTPELGVNAAIRLLNAVKENDFGGDFQKMVDFLLNKVNTEVNGLSLGINYVDDETGETSVNLGMLNYDGENMSFTLDTRYPKNADVETVNDTVKKAAEEYDMSVLDLTIAPLLYVPKDSELVTKLVKVFEEEMGEHYDPISIGGSTYAKEIPNMVAFGPTLPGDPDVIHQPDERIEVYKLIKIIQITAAAMYELACK